MLRKTYKKKAITREVFYFLDKENEYSVSSIVFYLDNKKIGGLEELDNQGYYAFLASRDSSEIRILKAQISDILGYEKTALLKFYFMG